MKSFPFGAPLISAGGVQIQSAVGVPGRRNRKGH